MKELNLVFLEKSDLQHQRKSLVTAVFGIPSIWEPQKNMFQQNYLRSEFVLTNAGEAGIVRKADTRKLKKSSISNIYNQTF